MEYVKKKRKSIKYKSACTYHNYRYGYNTAQIQFEIFLAECDFLYKSHGQSLSPVGNGIQS